MRDHPKPPASTAELTAYNLGYALSDEQLAWIYALGRDRFWIWFWRGIDDRSNDDAHLAER